jgi:hypothetical protein
LALKWQPHGVSEVARRCRAECLNGARSGRMLVLLLADLLAFDVEAAIEAPIATAEGLAGKIRASHRGKLHRGVCGHAKTLGGHEDLARAEPRPDVRDQCRCLHWCQPPGDDLCIAVRLRLRGGWRDSGRSHSRNTATMSHPARGQRGELRRRYTERWIDLVTTTALSSVCPGIDT